jgi:hypothetical protein
MATVSGSVKVGSTTIPVTADITLPSSSTADPGPTNTGVTGTLKAATQADLAGAKNGSVFQNLAITVTAPFNPTFSGTVTFRNCKFINGGVYWMVLLDAGVTHVIFEDCEFDGKNSSTIDSCVNGSNFEMRRCNVHGSVDGIKAGWDVSITDSYIHDLTITSSSHNDGIQCLGTDNLTIQHNTIIIKNGGTSCVLLSTGSASEMKNVLIDNNLVAGGAYCIYGGYQSGVDTLSKVSNIRVTNNRVSTQVNTKGGSYGPFASVDSPVVFSGNVWADGANAGKAI